MFVHSTLFAKPAAGSRREKSDGNGEPSLPGGARMALLTALEPTKAAKGSRGRDASPQASVEIVPAPSAIVFQPVVLDFGKKRDNNTNR